MTTVRLSLIIPAYNVGTCINKCLDSILSQSYKNIEIIIVNDGSTDNTLSVINSYSEKDERIVVVNKDNEGASIARSVGLKKAKGNYVLYIDGDDCLMDESALDVLIYTLETKDVDILFFNYQRLDDAFNKIPTRSFPVLTTSNPEISLKELYVGEYWNIGSNIHKRDLYERIIDMDDHNNVICGEDCILLTRLMLVASSVAKIEKAYYGYVQREDSVSSVAHRLSKKKYDDLFNLSVILNSILIKYHCKLDFDFALSLLDARLLITTLVHGNMDRVSSWSKRVMMLISIYPEMRHCFSKRYYNIIKAFSLSYFIGLFRLYYYKIRYDALS